MNPEFNDCLKKGRIKPFEPGPNLVPKELESARGDLQVARDSFGQRQYKWSTVQTYYSMFHSARAGAFR